MVTDDLIQRCLAWSTFMANVFVGMAAFQFHQRRRMRSLLWLVGSSGIGAALCIVAWAAETSSTRFWRAFDIICIADQVIWAAVICLVFRDLSRDEGKGP